MAKINIIPVKNKTEANDYVEANNLYYEEKKISGKDIIWWTDVKFKFSDMGMRKVAHYDDKTHQLYVY